MSPDTDPASLLPSEFLTRMVVQQQQFTCMHWLSHFQVMSFVPFDEQSISYSALAAAAKVPETTLKSVCRMAMTTGFFRETQNGQVAHTTLSASFTKNIDNYNWMMYMATKTVPSMASFVKATELWGDSTKPNESAYSLAMGTDLAFFEHINSTPGLADEFSAYMKSQARSHVGANVDFLKQSYDWGALGTAKVVDVGGGRGEASIALAESFPNLSFVVQDLPNSIEAARSQAVSLSGDTRSRIEFCTHDFFTAQPVRGADVYLLRLIIHDWHEVKAMEILKQITLAMGPRSQILIMDMVLPRPGTTPPEYEAALRQKDLTMKQGLNAKEREIEDWHSLIAKTDPRLHIATVRTPQTSQLSLLEIVWKDTMDSEQSNMNGDQA